VGKTMLMVAAVVAGSLYIMSAFESRIGVVWAFVLAMLWGALIGLWAGITDD